MPKKKPPKTSPPSSKTSPKAKGGIADGLDSKAIINRGKKCCAGT